MNDYNTTHNTHKNTFNENNFEYKHKSARNIFYENSMCVIYTEFELENAVLCLLNNNNYRKNKKSTSTLNMVKMK